MFTNVTPRDARSDSVFLIVAREDRGCIVDSCRGGSIGEEPITHPSESKAWILRQQRVVQ